MSEFRTCERRVLAHGPASNGEQRVARRDAAVLAAGGQYRESSGSPANAQHWRRRLADGSCLHLVIEPRRCRLHHDSYDPDASLLAMAMHMVHEARSEAASLAALGWSVVSLLAQR